MGRVCWKRERWASKEPRGKLGGSSDAGNSEEPSVKRRLVSPGSRLPLLRGLILGGLVDGLVRIVPTPPTIRPPALALHAHGDVIGTTYTLK